MRGLMLTLSLLAVAGCASQPGQTRLQMQAKEATRLEQELAGFKPGKPVECLRNRDAYSLESYGDTTLLFRVGKDLVYRNDTSGSCRGVGRGEALITRQYQSQLCRGDIARTADLTTGFESGSCALGPFIPYRRARP